jgi:hypothetical protein
MVEHSVRDAGAAGSSPVIPIFQFQGLTPVTRMGGRPLNEPSPLSLPLAPKNGLVSPKVFLICFWFFGCYRLRVTDHGFRFLGLAPVTRMGGRPFFCHISDRRSFATLTWKSAALGRPFVPRNSGLTWTQQHLSAFSPSSLLF